MMTRLAAWLRALAEWLDPQDPLIAKALEIVTFTEQSPKSGPYKAAVALGRMRQAFPKEKDSRLKWAIESAVQRL
jgi:hypothetical protein